MRALVVLLLLGGVAQASVDLSDVTKAAPACERAHCFQIQLHVAANDDGLVVKPDWIAAQVAEANRHFAPLEIGFVVGGVDTASLPEVPGRAERDGFVKLVKGRTIHVFITGELANVDESGVINGVTWHRDGKTYVIVSAKAWSKTLAHELGHFFGLPHSTYAISIMNKTKRDDPPVADRTFAPEEVEAMKPVIRRKLRELAVTRPAS